MKIGILTLFHGNINWGGVLQGYALKTYLEQQFPGSKVDILKYKSRENIVYPKKYQQALQYSPTEILSRVYGRFAARWKPDITPKISGRKQLFTDFMNEFTTNDKSYNDSNLIYAAREYDCLICGSDQIWNPNVARPGYFLSMVGDECLKISYAASIARDLLTKHEQNVILPLIKEFDFVSVRERTAKEFLENYTDGKLHVNEVLDPALMLSEEMWAKLSGTNVNDKNYALAFFFSESIIYRREIEKYAGENKLALKFIAYAKNEYIKSDEEGKCERLYDVGPREFIRLFQEASCVFTDSFHGSVFSILFNKPFFVFERDKNTKTSKNSRLYDLLNKFSLSNRLIRDVNELNAVLKRKINYSSVNEKLNGYRAESKKFLEAALSKVKCKEERRLETIADLDNKCCGCGLCMNVCPKKCIVMEVNQEGFLQPHVNSFECMKCQQCVKLCPSLHHVKTTDKHDCFVGYNKNEKVRTRSSSGGLFWELAKNIIDSSGVVYGAAFNKQFGVEHVRVDNVEGLKALQGSKYVQSNTKNVYNEMIADLKTGKTVMFCGTPCQIGAAYNIAYERKLEDKLFLIDFICHGVPSHEVWQSYLAYRAKSLHNIDTISFRDKEHGSCSWHDYGIYIGYKDGSYVVKSHDLDLYMDSFLTGKNIRESCYNCEYKGKMYVSDITMGDAWKIEKTCLEWADDKGASLFIIRSDKGKYLMESISTSFAYREDSYEMWTRYNPSLVYSSDRANNRDVFFYNFINRQSDKVFWKQQNRKLFKKKCRYAIKKVIRIIKADKLLRRYIS